MLKMRQKPRFQQPLYDFDERSRPASLNIWKPSPLSIVGVHLFHHPDFHRDPLVAAGKKSPADWSNDVRHGDFALVFDIEVNRRTPWMFKVTVLVAGQLLTMGGKWLRPLDEFEDYC